MLVITFLFKALSLYPIPKIVFVDLFLVKAKKNQARC